MYPGQLSASSYRVNQLKQCSRGRHAGGECRPLNPIVGSGAGLCGPANAA